MKKFLLYFKITAMFFCLFSCAKDIVDVNGSISGVIKDFDDGHLIQNCQVSLSPVGTTSITSSDGQFLFTNLEPGSYTLSFTKVGYSDLTKTVSVTSGQTSDVSITMKSKGAFSLSDTNLNFGDLNNTLTFSITNNSDSNCSFEITNIPSWASFSKKSGIVAAQENTAISVTVDRDKIDYGTCSQTVHITYKSNVQGNSTITLNIAKVKLTSPTVKIAPNAINVTQNSFDIVGEITATGGSEITNYGLCWSLTQNPTINDYHSSNGSTQEIGEFTTTASNLSVGTTYYVRAYATNAQGTAYSSQIIVSTQDIESNKWDGKIAETFAGGNGTAGNPYEIETGGQLLLMKNYPSSCFVITANIDLDNHNWLPFRFSGKLDGQNNTISNLNISRNIDNQGLFSVLENNAYINNLTIKGITINAENNNCIGALCGNIYYGKDISINNITVILTEKSQIIGMNSVGGIVGYIDYAQNIEIANCYITSASSGYAIKGNNFVGGIAGNTHANYSFANNISACRVSASITGGDYVGGIVGSARYFEIQKCSYNGNIKANEYAGGIAGSSREYPIIACKTIADIISSSYAGGIIGFAEFANIIACYSVGSLNAPEGNGILGYNKIGTAYLCYTTMSCGLGNTCIDSATTAVSGSGKNTVNLCTNITKHLQEAYSDYASYYNFDNTWMSDGVSCPRLAWENSN